MTSDMREIKYALIIKNGVPEVLWVDMIDGGPNVRAFHSALLPQHMQGRIVQILETNIKAFMQVALPVLGVRVLPK